MSRWKAVERAVAEILGGKRVPVTGRSRGDAPDIEHDIFSVEVKTKQKLPAWLHDAMEQAEKAQRGNQLPLVVLHQKHRAAGDAYAVVRLKNWRVYAEDTAPGDAVGVVHD